MNRNAQCDDHAQLRTSAKARHSFASCCMRILLVELCGRLGFFTLTSHFPSFLAHQRRAPLPPFTSVRAMLVYVLMESQWTDMGVKAER